MSATCSAFFGKLHLSKSATLVNFDGLRKTLEADLEGPEDAGGGLEDAVDAVGHMEPMGPGMILKLLKLVTEHGMCSLGEL